MLFDCRTKRSVCKYELVLTCLLPRPSQKSSHAPQAWENTFLFCSVCSFCRSDIFFQTCAGHIDQYIGLFAVILGIQIWKQSRRRHPRDRLFSGWLTTSWGGISSVNQGLPINTLKCCFFFFLLIGRTQKAPAHLGTGQWWQRVASKVNAQFLLCLTHEEVKWLL